MDLPSASFQVQPATAAGATANKVAARLDVFILGAKMRWPWQRDDAEMPGRSPDGHAAAV